MRIRRCLRDPYDQPKVALSLKIRMVKAERQSRPSCMDAVYSTWTLRQEHYYCAKLRTVHHRVLLRIIGAHRERSDHRMTLYNRALELTGCESIETTLRTRRLLWAGSFIRMSGAGGCRSESCLESLRVQCGEDGVGSRKSGPIAYRATFGRLA